MSVRLAVVLAAVVGVLGVVLAASAASDRPATTVRQEMVVNAPREVVWGLLTDFRGYDAWNPYITHATGSPRVGETIDLVLQPRNADAQEVECDILVVNGMRKIEWRCRTYLPGLLDREHTFRVLPMDDDHVRLAYEGRWEGLFVPFADLDDRKRGYERMTLALKTEAERATSESR